MLIGCVATVWLGWTNQLGLYIHPRYIAFTIIMALLGGWIALWSFEPIFHDELPKATRTKMLVNICVVLICVFAFAELLVMKPATLTSSTADQRGMNSNIGSGAPSTNAVPLFGGGDYTSFGVKDWASLLVQTNDPTFYAGKTASLLGFISPDSNDPQNVFFVTRFVITCCAVDARPVGVPVYAPNWQADHKANGWVKVEGGFIANPSPKSQQHVAIKPTKITNVDQPQDPYVY